MSSRSSLILPLAVVAALMTACDSAEERAENHYQSSLALLEDGDVNRAVVELRNVIRLDARHKKARRLYADLMFQRQKWREAYRSYLALVELYPTEVEPRIMVANMAIRGSRWDEAIYHGNRVIADAPQDPRAQLISAALDFRSAVSRRDRAARQAAADRAHALLGDLEDPSLAREIVIDDYLRDDAFADALPHVRAAIDAGDATEEQFRTKLNILTALGDDAGFEAALEDAVERFPEDTDFADELLAWYTGQGDFASGAAFLRQQAEAADGDDDALLTLVGYIRETGGDSAALAELDTIIAAGVNPPLFGSIAAEIRYSAGDAEDAIAQMRAIVETAEPGAQTRDIEVGLARMLAQTGQLIVARQLVDDVLAVDAGHVDALKMRAQWLIKDDRPDDAITALRAALDQAPRDAQAMGLMAQAHLGNGNRGLAGEMLSLAVEASSSAPEQALDYARFLIADGNDRTAETILVDALRVAPQNGELLQSLGQIYVDRQDWTRARGIEADLRAIDTEIASNVAEDLRMARLNSKQLSEEAIGFIEELAARPDTNAGELAVLRGHFAARDYASAERYIDVALAADPDQRVMRYLKASVMGATGRSDAARAIYRDLANEDPTDEIVWRALYATELRDGSEDVAAEILEAGLAALPDSEHLLWAKAGMLEAAGNFDGAIAVYETLYAKNPNAPVLANNLASLLSTHRTAQADLDRAYTVAKRLRNVSIPAFQDTYGWIAYRRGLFDEALAHLEPAAQALADDPMVNYRLAMAYLAALRESEALRFFRRAVDLAGPGDVRPAVEEARSEIARLEATIEGSDAN
ncbi:MAG: tetratricopeptide repeat protein [Pseudomonadota bacterium]